MNWKESIVEKPDVKSDIQQEYIFNYIGDKTIKEINQFCGCTSKVFANNILTVKYTPKIQHHLPGERQSYQKQLEVIYTDDSKELLTIKGFVVK